MSAMPPLMVPFYNELMMQLGWILFFSIAFPAGSFFTIFAGLLRVNIELTGMTEFKMKNAPKSVIDIGIYEDILELISSVGIVVCVYIVVFTSQKLTSLTEAFSGVTLTESQLFILAFVILHAIFFFKFILAVLIEDVPEWVAED